MISLEVKRLVCFSTDKPRILITENPRDRSLCDTELGMGLKLQLKLGLRLGRGRGWRFGLELRLQLELSLGLGYVCRICLFKNLSFWLKVSGTSGR